MIHHRGVTGFWVDARDDVVVIRHLHRHITITITDIDTISRIRISEDPFFRGDIPSVFEYYDSARKLGQEAYVEKGFAATANLFVWKGLFDGHGLFKGELVSGGDYEFGLRVTGGGEKLVYIPDAIVRHAARRTFGAIFAKSRRIAKGQRQLQKLGLLDRPSMRQLLPAKSWPVLQGRTEPISAVRKLQLMALQSIFRWLNFVVRQV